MSSDVKYLFRVFGPYPVQHSLGKSKNRINREDIKAFWNDVDSKQDRPEDRLSDAGGVYVFALRSDEGDPGKPWYVGKAAKQSFREECFTDDKLVHYHDVMEGWGNKKKERIMYFIARCKPKQRGFAKVPDKRSPQIENAIDYVEKNFISLGVQCNKKLDNVANARLMSSVSVEGVRNSKKRGQREGHVSKFRYMFGIETTTPF